MIFLFFIVRGGKSRDCEGFGLCENYRGRCLTMVVRFSCFVDCACVPVMGSMCALSSDSQAIKRGVRLSDLAAKGMHQARSWVGTHGQAAAHMCNSAMRERTHRGEDKSLALPYCKGENTRKSVWPRLWQLSLFLSQTRRLLNR